MSHSIFPFGLFPHGMFSHSTKQHVQPSLQPLIQPSESESKSNQPSHITKKYTQPLASYRTQQLGYHIPRRLQHIKTQPEPNGRHKFVIKSFPFALTHLSELDKVLHQGFDPYTLYCNRTALSSLLSKMVNHSTLYTIDEINYLYNVLYTLIPINYDHNGDGCSTFIQVYSQLKHKKLIKYKYIDTDKLFQQIHIYDNDINIKRPKIRQLSIEEKKENDVIKCARINGFHVDQQREFDKLVSLFKKNSANINPNTNNNSHNINIDPEYYDNKKLHYPDVFKDNIERKAVKIRTSCNYLYAYIENGGIMTDKMLDTIKHVVACQEQMYARAKRYKDLPRCEQEYHCDECKYSVRDCMESLANLNYDTQRYNELTSLTLYCPTYSLIYDIIQFDIYQYYIDIKKQAKLYVDDVITQHKMNKKNNKKKLKIK